jgi:hypothetical protein
MEHRSRSTFWARCSALASVVNLAACGETDPPTGPEADGAAIDLGTLELLLLPRLATIARMSHSGSESPDSSPGGGNGRCKSAGHFLGELVPSGVPLLQPPVKIQIESPALRRAQGAREVEPDQTIE